VDEQSIWKKEISFRRKPKEKKAPPEPGAEPTSIWKKEISFRRKPEPAEPVPIAPAAQAPKQSIWKKEIALGRKPKQDAPAPEPVAVAPKVEQPVAVAPKVEEPVAVPPAREPEPVAVAPEPVAAEPVAEEAPSGSEPESGGSEAASEEETAESAPLPLPAAETSPPVAAAEPTPAPPAVDVRPEPDLPVPSVMQVPVTPASAPEPVPEAPVVVHPPVPAAELPPVKSDQPVPFWKREIGLKRSGAKQADRKAEKRPKPEKAPRVKAERGGGKGKGKGQKLVGLKIGASQLAAARITNNGAAELLQVAREPLNAGVVVGGELRDPDALAVALRDFFSKHKLPKRGVRLGIANNRIGVRTFELEGITDQKQLDNAIRFRAQEALPIPIDEAVLDYQVLSETTGEEGELTRRILLVVAYREQIDRYVDACKQAGIALVGIDLEAFALLRALQAPQVGAGDDPDAALVAVAIGHERSTFAVSDGRVCEFTRVLEWGGSAINVALARALDAAPSEVESVKRALSLTDEMTPEGLTAEQAAKSRDAIRRAIQTFARELVSSLQFYQNQPGSLGIGEIVLTGGTTHLPGLANELEKLIGVHVRVGDPLARVKVAKKIGQPEQVGSLAVAIGLGIED
jgi:type IV pilus assembly protein PilM